MAKETSAARILREWTAAPRLRQADILLLQEVKQEPATECIANRLGEAMRFYVAYSPEEKSVTDRGLAILSRFPLRHDRTRALPRFDLRFHSRLDLRWPRPPILPGEPSASKMFISTPASIPLTG